MFLIFFYSRIFLIQIIQDHYTYIHIAASLSNKQSINEWWWGSWEWKIFVINYLKWQNLTKIYHTHILQPVYENIIHQIDKSYSFIKNILYLVEDNITVILSKQVKMTSSNRCSHIYVYYTKCCMGVYFRRSSFLFCFKLW